MKVLIIDDDPPKMDQLRELVRSRIPLAVISEAKSYQSGFKEAMLSRPNLVVVDMSMPTYDVTPKEPGGRPKPFAGREILRELTRRKIPTKVVIVTQFVQFGEGEELMTLTELKKELEELFSDTYLGTVYYHASQIQWRDELTRLIARVEE